MRRFWKVFCILILMMNRAYSQDSLKLDSTYQLKEILLVYPANQSSPTTYQNISAKGIEVKSTGQEPSFILSEYPSMTAYSDAGNTQGYSYFRMRGIDQTRINITLDGVPLNEPEDQGAYFSNYPDLLNSVSKIQIQRGVGTSKNGVASYGGSLQLFSPNLFDTTSTSLGIGYGSFQSYRGFGEFNSGVKQGKALYARASKVNADGYKYDSANKSQSVFISTGLFNKKDTWKLNFLLGQQKNELAWIGVPDSLIRLDRRTNGNAKEDDKFTQGLVQLQHNRQLHSSSSLQTSFYYTFLNGDYDFDLNNFLGLPQTSELYNYAFKSNLIGGFMNHTLSAQRMNWTTGVHGNIYNRQHLGSEKSIGQLYRNKGYKNEFSVFSKIDYTLKWLIFFIDLQYRHSSFDYEGAVHFDKTRWHFVNPKAGVTAILSSNSMVYYSVGATGREPTRNDMFGGNDDLLADSLGKAVLSIKTPEKVLDHELGIRQKSDLIQLDLNLFYMGFKNEIVLDGKFGPNGIALTNKVDKSFRAGIESSISFRLNSKIILTNHSSFNHARIKDQGTSFAPILTPKFISNQEMLFKLKYFSIALAARYQGKSYIDFANSSAINQYVLLNTRITVNTKKTILSLFLYNITNTRYFNHGYVDFDGTRKYFVQAPTNIYLSLQHSL